MPYVGSVDQAHRGLRRRPPFLKVWVIYDGLPDSLDIPRINSYLAYLHRAMLDAGIDALPSISYIPQVDTEEYGTPWIG